MFPILQKLTSTSREQCIFDIIQRYDHQGFGVVNYLYGAMIVQHRLLDIQHLWPSYALQQSLLLGDFLLPDGAALRTFRLARQTLVRCSYFSKSTTWKLPWILPNLNGTDFLPNFLDTLQQTGRSVTISTITVYDPVIGNPPDILKDAAYQHITERRWFPVVYQAQRDRHDPVGTFDRWQYRDSLLRYDTAALHILLVFHSSPQKELRTTQHAEMIRSTRVLVMNQGATIDFRAGRETRSPCIVRWLMLESLRRVCSDPRKNFKKFFISFRMIWLIVQKLFLKIS